MLPQLPEDVRESNGSANVGADGDTTDDAEARQQDGNNVADKYASSKAKRADKHVIARGNQRRDVRIEVCNESGNVLVKLEKEGTHGSDGWMGVRGPRSPPEGVTARRCENDQSRIVGVGSP